MQCRPGLAALRFASTLLVIWPCAELAAQVIAHPNQINGRLAFTNANPEIIELLNDPDDAPPGQQLGMLYGGYEAISLPPQTPELKHTALITADTRRGTAYELTVESGPPGEGIAYRIGVNTGMGPNNASRYRFAPRDSDPVEYEPAPDVRLDIEECVGVFRLLLLDSEGRPNPVSGGEGDAYREEPSGSGSFDPEEQAHVAFAPDSSVQHVIVRGDGSLYRIALIVELGSDPFFDLIRYPITLEARVDCDQVVEIPVTCRSAGDPGLGLGAITGRMDMLGEDEHYIDHSIVSIRTSFLRAEDGPYGNYRWHHIQATPSQGAFELPNLVPSTTAIPAVPYHVDAYLTFGLGHRLEYFSSPRLEVEVPAGTTVDLGDSFVFDPGSLVGELYLLGPPADPDWSGSALEWLWRSADTDADGDGLPDNPRQRGTGWGSHVQLKGSFTVAPGATWSSLYGLAEAGFEGGYDSESEAFAGDYRLVMGGLLGEPSLWDDPSLDLRIRNTQTPEEPRSYLSGGYEIRRNREPEILVTAGSQATLDHRYCLSELRLRYRSEGGTFNNPRAVVMGEFQGLDFELAEMSYSVSLSSFLGTPSDEPGASVGLVRMPLPEASYTLYPQVRAFNPSGGHTTLRLPEFDVRLGCREIHDQWTDFGLELDPAECTSAATLTLTGRVRGGAAIELIDYTVDGGAPIVHCNDCGNEPELAIPIDLAGEWSEIEVKARGEDARATTARLLIERVERPQDLGNTLLAVKQDRDAARFHWQAATDARASQLTRAETKAHLDPEVVATLQAPGDETVDEGAVSDLTRPFLTYQVQGLNCEGEPGP